MLLGPGLNIQRDPLGGRFFEYYTEDPCLNAALATAIVKGIQSEGVAACLKHYACNNREDNRNFYMSMVAPEPLNEVYLPAFKAGVEDGGAWAVMTSANGVNGDFVSDSKALLQDTLIDKFKFTGVILTDWLQTRSTEKAALAGLDVSMPGGPCGFAQPLLDAVKAARVPLDVLDDKVRRMLRLYSRLGVLDHRDMTRGASINTPEHQTVAREVADGGIVLLKNRGALLPLNPAQLNNVLVIGPRADKKFCVAGMGGSSWVQGPYEVTPLAGLTKVLGEEKVHYIASDDLGGFKPIPAEVMEPVDGVKGFRALYFQGGNAQPAVQRVDPQINFMWEMRTPDQDKIKGNDYSVHYVGHIDPPVDGSYTLRVTAGGSAQIMTEDGGAPVLLADRGAGRPTSTSVVQMKKGHPFYISLAYSHQPGDGSIDLEWETPKSSPDSWDKVDAAAHAADVVVFVGGIDHSIDTEGRDRVSMDFPAAQETILDRLVAANPKTIALLINGSPMEIGGWLPRVPAVVEAWYPGMEGGTSISDVLFGTVDPSGRLPFTWPRKLADSPSHAIGTEDNDHVWYKEGVMVGYRYFDTQNVEPEFPFGFGLSYATFDFSGLKLGLGKGTVEGAVRVRNTSLRDGLETVQVYVHPLNPSIARPVHELKAFRKTAIAAGGSTEVAFSLGPDAFSYYDESSGAWKFDPGRYEIQVGTSSRDILLRSVINVPGFARGR
jgi:beta-glucosidase